MLNISFRKIKETGYLTLKGELVSSYADDLRSALMIALSNSERVFVDLKEVTKFDDPCIKMLCLFSVRAKDLGKYLIFNTALLTDEFKQTLKPLLLIESFPAMGFLYKRHLQDDQYAFSGVELLKEES